MTLPDTKVTRLAQTRALQNLYSGQRFDLRKDELAKEVEKSVRELKKTEPSTREIKDEPVRQSMQTARKTGFVKSLDDLFAQRAEAEKIKKENFNQREKNYDKRDFVQTDSLAKASQKRDDYTRRENVAQKSEQRADSMQAVAEQKQSVVDNRQKVMLRRKAADAQIASNLRRQQLNAQQREFKSKSVESETKREAQMERQQKVVLETKSQVSRAKTRATESSTSPEKKAEATLQDTQQAKSKLKAAHYDKRAFESKIAAAALTKNLNEARIIDKRQAAAQLKKAFSKPTTETAAKVTKGPAVATTSTSSKKVAAKMSEQRLRQASIDSSKDDVRRSANSRITSERNQQVVDSSRSEEKSFERLEGQQKENDTENRS